MKPTRKGKVISTGKAKTLYETNNPDYLVMEFRNDTSAFDGVKTEKLDEKGMVNNKINAFIMKELEMHGITTHHVKLLSDTESEVWNLKMLPIECVVRNYAAGSLCKRLGIREGFPLNPPIFEFFLKDDALHDPMINESHILTFDWATQRDMQLMKDKSLAINGILERLFAEAGLLLVDYKLEFGWFEEMTLGDEFTPDGCRLWDSETHESFDKDRFRKDEGDVVEYYKQVAERLGVDLSPCSDN